MSKLFPTFSKIPGAVNGLVWRAFARALPFDPQLMLRELASMMRSGVPMDRALELVGEGRQLGVRHALRRVRERVEAGEPLSQALDSLPGKWAPAVVRSTVAAGERSGRLPELLDQIVREYERLGIIDRRLKSVLIYPLCVGLLALCIFQIVFTRVMPTFEAIYAGLGIQIPLLARIVSGVWLVMGPILWIAVPLTLGYLMVSLYRRDRFRGASGLVQGLAWRLPIVRGLRRALIEVRFASVLRVLVEAGVTLPEALDICEGVVADDLAGNAIVESCRRIRGGEAPSSALRGLTFLSPAFIWFLTDTEHRGDFLEVTAAMAEAAEDRFLTRVEVLERVLEPATTAILGIIIGTTVIAFYQVLFLYTRGVG